MRGPALRALRRAEAWRFRWRLRRRFRWRLRRRARWEGEAREAACDVGLRRVHDPDKGGCEHCLILVAAAFRALARCA